MTGPRPQHKIRSSWERIDIMAMGGVEATIYQRNVHDGHLTAIVAQEPIGPGGEMQWHLSISHRTNSNPPKPGRYPAWDEIAHARYELLPHDLTFGMLLPPPDEYVAVHDTTFHLHEFAEGAQP